MQEITAEPVWVVRCAPPLVLPGHHQSKHPAMALPVQRSPPGSLPWHRFSLPWQWMSWASRESLMSSCPSHRLAPRAVTISEHHHESVPCSACDLHQLGYMSHETFHMNPMVPRSIFPSFMPFAPQTPHIETRLPSLLQDCTGNMLWSLFHNRSSP